MIYSVSRLKKYDCPKAFYERYVVGIIEPSGEAAFLGKVVHKATELLIIKEYDNVIEAVNKGLEICTEEERKNGFPAPAINMEDAINFTGWGYKNFQKIYKESMQIEPEKHFQLSLNPDDPFAPEIQGFIDLHLLEDPYSIVWDWKTNFVAYEVTDNHQLGLYAWAISQIRGIKKIKGALCFLRKGTSIDKTLKTHVFKPEELEAARKWAHDRANEIEGKLAELEFGGDPGELFPANPKSGLCKFCSIACDCQKQSEAKPDSITSMVEHLEKSDLEINSPDQAVEMGAEYLRLKAASDKILNALKNYCKETSSQITVADQEYGPSTSTSWKLTSEQKKEFAKLLLEKELNPWEIISVGSTEINKAKLAEDELLSLGAVKSETTTYRWAKVKSEEKIEEKKPKEKKSKGEELKKGA